MDSEKSHLLLLQICYICIRNDKAALMRLSRAVYRMKLKRGSGYRVLSKARRTEEKAQDFKHRNTSEGLVVVGGRLLEIGRSPTLVRAITLNCMKATCRAAIKRRRRL